MKNKLSRKQIAGIIVVIAVIIIPLFYSYFYLGAFWDPYSRLDKLPVAVVNNDQGAMINGKERNIGQELCDKLSDEAALKFVFTDEQTAKAGTEGKDYYAMIVIPNNFSENIASSGTIDKKTATITYSPNEKRNYLASQILSKAVLQIEESVRSSVDKEIVQELTDNIKAVPDQMYELQDGLTKLQNGSNDLAAGAGTLAEGTATFRDKFDEYQNGVNTLNSGSTKLNSGVVSLNKGIGNLQAGADQLVNSTKNIDQLTSGAKSLADGAEAFNKNLTVYTSGVDALIRSVTGTSDFLKQYVTTVNPSIMKDPVFAGFITKLSDPANAKNIEALQAANSKLKEASAQISAGASKLSSGTENLPDLKEALIALSAGLSKAKSGSSELVAGTNSLVSGISTVTDATAKLSDAVGDINQGANDLKVGTGELSDGIATAKSGVSTSITDTNNQLNTLDGLADFAESPVNVEQSNITSVPNYGTAFAPYFLSLSLWVGALIMFVGIYLDSDSKFKILSRDSDHKVLRSFLYLLIGVIQAVVLAEALKIGLGLKVDNETLYFIACILVSITFISIVQFLMVHLKDIGKFLTILLLILQLTSCGGTFPMETVPKFFNLLYPFMPMTYSVGLFRQVISGVETAETAKYVLILSIILVSFVALTMLISAIKTRKAMIVEKVQEPKKNNYMQ